jgi:hypothetical protein
MFTSVSRDQAGGIHDGLHMHSDSASTKKHEMTEETGKKTLALATQLFTLALPLQEKDEAAAACVKAQGPATHQVGHIAYDNRSNQPP